MEAFEQMLPATPEYSCEARDCRCFGSGRERFDLENNRCRTCDHSVEKHAPCEAPIAAKLFLSGRTIVDAICLQCSGPIVVASRLTAGATGQKTYAFGAVLSHLRAHGIETPLSPVMLTEPLKPVAYFAFQQ